MTPREQEAWGRLAAVIDPETGLGLVDLGLIYELREEGEGLALRMTLIHESCPLGSLIVQMAREALEPICPDGAVVISLSFDPPWTVERITPAGRTQLNR